MPGSLSGGIAQLGLSESVYSTAGLTQTLGSFSF